MLLMCEERERVNTNIPHEYACKLYIQAAEQRREGQRERTVTTKIWEIADRVREDNESDKVTKLRCACHSRVF
jgi:hypothetical protein